MILQYSFGVISIRCLLKEWRKRNHGWYIDFLLGQVGKSGTLHWNWKYQRGKWLKVGVWILGMLNLRTSWIFKRIWQTDNQICGNPERAKLGGIPLGVTKLGFIKIYLTHGGVHAERMHEVIKGHIWYVGAWHLSKLLK